MTAQERDSIVAATRYSIDEKVLFALVVNSEDYYYHLSDIRGKDRDAYKAAYEYLVKAINLGTDNYKDIKAIQKAYDALDREQKETIKDLLNTVNKEQRRKKFWKTVAIIEGGIVMAVAGALLTVFL